MSYDAHRGSYPPGAELARGLERIGRDISSEAKSHVYATGRLRESILGGSLHHYVPFLPPATRRVRVARAIAEGRRRLSEAFIVLRTGSTSYEDDL